MTHYHFIGIGGSGLSAIARILLERGEVVTGSDRTISPLAEELAIAGARIYNGHQPAHIEGVDVVIRSSAIPDENPEVQAARKADIPVIKRADFLEQLMAGQDGIAVAGTHGKTTTTAMIAWMLSALGFDPSYIIGGVSKNLGNNAHHGRGPYFVIEADEYDRMFLGMRPKIGIVTFLEHDHPDCFPTPKVYRQAFVEFIHCIQTGGCLLVCQDTPGAAGLASECGPRVVGLTYGLSAAANYRAELLNVNPWGGFTFEALCPDARQVVHLQVPGEHNVLNALASLAVAHRLGLPLDQAGVALGKFSGTGRRFDVVGESNGITVIDDYAHHPTEIRTTLAAARSRFPGRSIWVVWQPHTYSRTKSLLTEFAAAFTEADHVLVPPIYAAREKDNGFSAAVVVGEMKHPDAQYLPGLDEVSSRLIERLQPGDVVLVLSAGDADQISARVLKYFQAKESTR